MSIFILFYRFSGNYSQNSLYPSHSSSKTKFFEFFHLYLKKSLKFFWKVSSNGYFSLNKVSIEKKLSRLSSSLLRNRPSGQRSVFLESSIIYSIFPMTNEKIIKPLSMQMTANNLSELLLGWKSPKPTVENVVNMK